MRMYTTLAAAAALLTVGACSLSPDPTVSTDVCAPLDQLCAAREAVAAKGYADPVCVHSYLPHPIGKFDAKGQHCTASDGRVAWVNGSKVTEAK